MYPHSLDVYKRQIKHPIKLELYKSIFFSHKCYKNAWPQQKDAIPGQMDLFNKAETAADSSAPEP